MTNSFEYFDFTQRDYDWFVAVGLAFANHEYKFENCRHMACLYVMDIITIEALRG